MSEVINSGKEAGKCKGYELRLITIEDYDEIFAL